MGLLDYLFAQNEQPEMPPGMINVRGVPMRPMAPTKADPLGDLLREAIAQRASNQAQPRGNFDPLGLGNLPGMFKATPGAAQDQQEGAAYGMPLVAAQSDIKPNVPGATSGMPPGGQADMDAAAAYGPVSMPRGPGGGGADEPAGSTQPDGESIPLPRFNPKQSDISGVGMDMSARGAAQPPAGAPMPIAPPAQAVAPPAAAMPPGGQIAAPAQENGFLKKISDNTPLLLALAGGFAGAPSIGTGMRRAFSNAAPVAASTQKMRNEQETAAAQKDAIYKQYVAAKVPPNLAMLAANDPVARKQIADQYFGADKVKLDKIKRPDGSEVPVWVDSSNKKVTAADVPGGAAGGDSTLNESQKARVQAIIEGREPYPSPNTRSGDAQFIREAVHNADPSFDGVNYNARLQTRKDFTSGKSAQNLTAFNTAIGHLGSLYDSIDGLNNSSVPMYNRVSNAVASELSPSYQEAHKKFQASRTAVADELTRAFRGSGGNVHDIKAWEETINAADSPGALKAAVRQAAELLNSRVAAVGDQYNRGMGTTKDHLDLLNPKAAESFRHLLEGGKPKPAAKVAPLAGKTTSGISWKIEDGE